MRAAGASREKQSYALARRCLPPDTGASNTLNWAGYVTTGGTYTSVSGTWTVPHVANASVNGAEATWVGIGGTLSRDLIQAGTASIPDSDGTISYRAWLETLPQISQAVPLSISPGDAVSVSINQENGDTWLVSFSNATTGQSYQTIVHYRSSLSSAEWIEEMPGEFGGSVWLDDFGTIDFSSGHAIKNGETVTITQPDALPFTMDNEQGRVIASPSAFGADGSSFSVSRSDASATPESVDYASMAALPVGEVQELCQKIESQQAQTRCAAAGNRRSQSADRGAFYASLDEQKKKRFSNSLMRAIRD